MVIKIWSYLELTHPYAAGAILISTIVFTLLANGQMPETTLLLRVVGVVAFGQACVGITNELADMPHDRVVKPHRPLIDGRVNPHVARFLAWAVGIGSLLLGLTFGWIGILFSVIGTGAGLWYNFWLKGTMWSWLPYAISFSLLPIWPFAALDRWKPQLMWIWLLILPASIALNIAQSLGDIEGDRTAGIGGLAERMGRNRALATLWATCVLTIVFALVTVAQIRISLIFLIAVVIATSLITLAAWYCFKHPGETAWSLTWRLVTAAMGLLGIGWFSAIL